MEAPSHTIPFPDSIDMSDTGPEPSGSGVGAVKEDAPPAESLDNPQSSQTEERPEPIAPTFLLDEIEALKQKLMHLERLALDSRAAGEDDLPQPRRTADNDLDQLQAGRVAKLEDYRRREQCLYGHRKEFEANGGPGEWTFFGKSARYKSGHGRITQRMG